MLRKRFDFNISFDIVLLMCTITLSGIWCGDLPHEITKCQPGEEACIIKAIHDILRLYPKGNPEFGLKPLDAVFVDHISLLSRPGNNPIQLNIELYNMTAYGIEMAVVDRIVGFEKDPSKSKFEVYVQIPDFRMQGQYEMDGKMLLLPMKGKGETKISCKNLKVGVKAKVGEYKKDGKQYIKIDKMLVKAETDLLTVNFENLLGENKEIGSSINSVINENWRDVWVELEESIEKSFAIVLDKLVSDVIASLSYDDFFNSD